MVLMRLSKPSAVVTIVFAIGFMVLSQWRTVIGLSNNLSPVADGFSESNAIRAGESYVDQGFTHAAGLPNICYGGRFPDAGRFGETGGVPMVYTHYPPGPDLLVGLYTLVFGKGAYLTFRKVPIALGGIALAFLAYCLIQAFGIGQTAVVFLSLSLIPMASSTMHGLHYQGYATSMLLIQIGLTHLFLSLPLRRFRIFGLGFFGIGLIQGYLSFDYFFLVALAGIPGFLLVGGAKSKTETMRHLVTLVAFPIIGFVIAHLLHLLQVAAYYGSVGAATRDLMQAASNRSQWSSFHSTALLIRYLFILLSQGPYLGVLGALGLGVAFASLCVPTSIRIRFPFSVHWCPTMHEAAGVLSALVISSLWIVTMPAHAHYHGHFIPRHYLLTAVYVLLGVASSISGNFQGGNCQAGNFQERWRPTDLSEGVG